jgi:hypothetical protein
VRKGHVNYPHENIEHVGTSLQGHAQTLRGEAASGGGGLPGGSLGSLGESAEAAISGHLTNVPGQINTMADREDSHGRTLARNSQAMREADERNADAFRAIQPESSSSSVRPSGGGSGGSGGGGGRGGGPTEPGGSGRDPLWDNTSLFPMPAGNGRQIADLTQHPDGVTRDDNGLITHVGNRPIEEVTDMIGEQRARKYREAAQGNKGLSQSQIRQQQANGTFVSANTAGTVSAVVVDRRTGKVYEGVNGTASDVVGRQQSTDGQYEQDPTRLHPTLQSNVDQMEAQGPYPALDRNGNVEAGGDGTRAYPHYDSPYGHAEVKAQNTALWDRRAAGLDDGPTAQGEMYAQTYTPFAKMSDNDAPLKAMPFCTNCNSTMGTTGCYAGRYTGFPADPATNLTGVYPSGGGTTQ